MKHTRLAMNALIGNPSHAPSLDDITALMQRPAGALWRELHTWVQQTYRARPKVQFSRCTGKMGWNVKYARSGKSLCTLYPEGGCFIALVTIPAALIPLATGEERGLCPLVLNLIRSGKPLNGSQWLMIPVSERATLDSVKALMRLKTGSS